MKTLIIDLETDSLEAARSLNSRIWCIGLKVEDEEPYVVPWDEVDKVWLQSLFDSHNVVTHNASFDKAVLELRGFRIPNFDDTCVMSYVWHPGGEHSLEAWGIQLGVPKLEHTDFTSFTPEMSFYCSNDVLLTFILYKHLQKLFETDNRAKTLYEDIERPYIEAIIEMNGTGFYLDIPKLYRMRDQLQRKVDDLSQEVISMYPLVPRYTDLTKTKTYKKGYFKRAGVTYYDHCELVEMNPNSSVHKLWALKHLYGWQPEKKTKAGKYCVDSSVLKSLDYPLAKTLLELSECTKILGTYVESFLVNQEHGRVCTNFNNTVTLTGRLSSSNPINFQNFPKSGEYGDEIRKCVSTPRGWKLVGADLASIEARVLAHYLSYCLQDGDLKKAIEEGLDVHQFNADKLGISRDEAKLALYAFAYGAGPEKLGKGDKIRGQEILDSIKVNYPSLVSLKELFLRKVRRQKGVIHTWFGRRLVYPAINSEDQAESSKAERQVFNAMLQGTAADIMKKITLDVLPTVCKCGGRLAASIHDEALFYVPAKKAKEVSDAVSRCFNRTDLLSECFVKSTPYIGETWYALK